MEEKLKAICKILANTNHLMGSRFDEKALYLWAESLIEDGYTLQEIQFVCKEIPKKETFFTLQSIYKYIDQQEKDVNYFDKLRQMVKKYGAVDGSYIREARKQITKNEKPELLDLWNEFALQIAHSDPHSDRTFLMNSINKRGNELQKFHKQQEQKVKLGYVKREEIDYKNSTMNTDVKKHIEKRMLGEIK